MSRNVASTELGREACRILKRKCEGKRYRRGLVANVDAGLLRRNFN